jgi:hypothetical protein
MVNVWSQWSTTSRQYIAWWDQGILLYKNRNSPESGVLQNLFTIIMTRQQLPQGGTPAEEELLRPLRDHVIRFKGNMQMTYGHYLQSASRPNGSTMNGQANGHSLDGRPQTNSGPSAELLAFKTWVLAYHASDSQEAKGTYLQGLFMILTSERPPQSGVSWEQSAIEALSHCAQELEELMDHASTFYEDNGLSINNLSASTANNFQVCG